MVEITPDVHDSTMIGYFSFENGWTIHCIDTNPFSSSKSGAYEDVSLVPKYRMSEEEYDAREGTLRDWTRKQMERDATFTLAKHAREHRERAEAQRQAKLGLELPKGFEYDAQGKVVRVEQEQENQQRADAGNRPTEQQQQDIMEVYGPETAQGIQVGERCEVQPGGRRGRAAFVGEVVELGGGGFWVGVIFDEPVGRADGSVKGGKRYFEAEPGYGGFVRGKNVQVGDFPERDILDELDGSEDEI